MKKETADSAEPGLVRVNREASEWVVRQAYGLSSEEQDEFLDWLGEDSNHAEAYANRQKTWKQLDILADWRPEHSLTPNPDLLDTETREKRVYASWMTKWVASIAAVLALGLGMWIFTGSPEAERLAEGEFSESYERHVLEDGSIVELNRESQAFVRYTETSRNVELVRGEAHFTISKDEARPFVVTARGVAVQAVGTMFNVQIESDSVDVLVTEGRVMLGSAKAGEPVLQVEAIGSTVQELSAGQRSVVSSSRRSRLPEVELVSEADIEKELTWLNQLLVFNATPLEEIVMELNRRNSRKIFIEDPSIRDEEMSVNISPNNIDAFVSALEITKNIEAERMGDSVIVLRSRE